MRDNEIKGFYSTLPKFHHRVPRTLAGIRRTQQYTHFQITVQLKMPAFQTTENLRLSSYHGLPSNYLSRVAPTREDLWENFIIIPGVCVAPRHTLQRNR